MKYDFKCKECSSIFEIEQRLVDYTGEADCECGGTAKRIILAAPTVHLDPISGDHIGATDRWAKGRERQMKKERHNLKEHGTER